MLTGLALVPSGAHFFELPNKIGLSEPDYFTVQSIYRGWALFGSVILAAIAANLSAAVLCWRRGKPFWASLAAGLILTATLLVFFEWTYPANQATKNWSAVSSDWELLRRQWELSHAANAILTFVAFCCAALSQSLGKPTTADASPIPRGRSH